MWFFFAILATFCSSCALVFVGGGEGTNSDILLSARGVDTTQTWGCTAAEPAGRQGTSSVSFCLFDAGPKTRKSARNAVDCLAMMNSSRKSPCIRRANQSIPWQRQWMERPEARSRFATDGDSPYPKPLTSLRCWRYAGVAYRTNSSAVWPGHSERQFQTLIFRRPLLLRRETTAPIMSARTIGAERLAVARRHDEHCLLCEHRCGVNRSGGERGVCEADACARVFRHRVECGEELELVPSHVFYLSGCDLRCVFCIGESNAFDPQQGQPLTSAFLSETVAWGVGQGARNVQWAGGEPTIHLPAILGAMAECRSMPTIVWKSDFHATAEAFELLDGVVDVYVADFKFGNDACAKEIGGVDDYLRIVTRNMLIAADQADLIVRHLLLPGHFDCCYRPVVDWMRRRLPATRFSVRDGYVPRWRAKHVDRLSEHLECDAGRRARSLAAHSGLRLIQ